jgi:hypothetical protein
MGYPWFTKLRVKSGRIFMLVAFAALGLLLKVLAAMFTVPGPIA